jgi:hypothetical protein
VRRPFTSVLGNPGLRTEIYTQYRNVLSFGSLEIGSGP